MMPQQTKKSQVQSIGQELSEVQAAASIYIMPNSKGQVEFFPRPSALGQIKPKLSSIDAKSAIVKSFGSSLVSVKKFATPSLTLAKITGGLRRLI